MNLAGFLKPLSALLAGAWLSRGLNFLTVILLVRRLGLSDIGLFYTVLGWAGVATVVSEFGVNRILVARLQQSDDRNGVFSAGLLVRLAFCLLVYVGAVLLVGVLSYPPFVRQWVPWYLVTIFFMNTRTLFYALFQVWGSFMLMSLIDLSVSLAHLAFAVILWERLTIGMFLTFMIVTNGVSAVVAGFVAVSRGWRWAGKGIGRHLRELLFQAMPLGLSGISVVAYHQCDVLMVSLWCGEQSAGILAVIKRVLELGIAIVEAVTVVSLPRLSAAWREGPLALDEMRLRTTWAMVGLVVPFVSLMLAYPDIVLWAVSKKDLSGAHMALALSSFFLVKVGYGGIHSTLLVVRGLTWYDPLFLGTLAVASLVSNILLIPRYGVDGACLTMVVIMALYFLLALGWRTTRPWIRTYLHGLIIPALVCMALVFVAKAVPSRTGQCLAFLGGNAVQLLIMRSRFRETGGESPVVPSPGLPEG